MRFFSALSRISKVMTMWVIAVCLALLSAGLLAIHVIYPFEESLPFIAGVILGCLHSVIKVALLEKSLNRVINMEKDGAESVGRLHFIGRYFLTAAVFIIVILSRGYIGLFGTILGVLSLQIAAYITGHIMKNKQS